jgi:mRNA interferase MazF
MNSSILRGELYYADLNPTIGSEQGGIRPVLIISNNIGNRHSPTVIVAAITSKAVTKASLPTHYFLEIAQPSIVLLEQIRTIDKKRLRDKVGTVNQATMREIDKSLAISLSLNLKE